MNAKGDSIAFLGELKELKVPFFQRHYVWQKENWEEPAAKFSKYRRTAFPWFNYTQR